MQESTDQRPDGPDGDAWPFRGAIIPFAFVNPGGECPSVSDEWTRLFGRGDDEPWGWLTFVAPYARARVRRELEFALSTASFAEIEAPARRADGTECEIVLASAPHKSDEGVIDGSLVIAWDITERRRNEERLAFMAGHDALTGLANRRVFLEGLERAVQRAGRGVPSVLLMFDVDRLKAYNDARGHLEGDQALVNIGMLIRRHVRAADMPARIGGDEFAVLLEECTTEEALLIAERIRGAATAEEFVPGARELGVGLSCGVAFIDAGTDVRGAMERADLSLYAAKHAGRNRVVVWSQQLAGASGSERIASKVHEAFAQDGFFLVFQPVVRLDTDDVAYYESLVRMRTDDGSVYGAGEFLPVVERLGLMPRLTRRVIDLALWALVRCPTASVSVNLSLGDLGDPALLAEVERAVSDSPATRGRMIFEIAEETLLGNLAGGREWMAALGEAGCRFVLDEFGTGLGMFVLLRERSIEQVKLSRTVVHALSEQESTRAFVIAMRELIESQGKHAVATFLESEGLLGQARDSGFVLGQGFLLSEPCEDLCGLVGEAENLLDRSAKESPNPCHD